MESSAYNATTAESTTTRTERVSIDTGFPLTIVGILTIAAVLSSFAFAICGSVWPWSWYGGGYIAFVGWVAFIGGIALFVLYLLRLLPRLPGPWGLIILIYLAAIILLSFIAFIVSAVNGQYFSAAIASAVFGVLVMGLHGGLGFFMFMKWRAGGNDFHRGECGASASGMQQQQQHQAEPKSDAPPAYGNY